MGTADQIARLSNRCKNPTLVTTGKARAGYASWRPALESVSSIRKDQTLTHFNLKGVGHQRYYLLGCCENPPVSLFRVEGLIAAKVTMILYLFKFLSKLFIPSNGLSFTDVRPSNFQRCAAAFVSPFLLAPESRLYSSKNGVSGSRSQLMSFLTI